MKYREMDRLWSSNGLVVQLYLQSLNQKDWFLLFRVIELMILGKNHAISPGLVKSRKYLI